MCGSTVDIQFTTDENRRGKEEEEERRNHRTKISWPALLHRAAITNFCYNNIKSVIGVFIEILHVRE